MSHAAYVEAPEYYSKYEYAQHAHSERRRSPGLITTSLIATAIASVFTGAAVLTKVSQIPEVNVREAVGPITPYTGLQWEEDAARRSGVVRGKLAVLTPPTYAEQPRFVLPSAAPVVEAVSAYVSEGEELAAHLDAYPSAEAAPNAETTTDAAIEAQAVVVADMAAAEATVMAEETATPRYVLPEEVAPPAQIIEEPVEVPVVEAPAVLETSEVM